MPAIARPVNIEAIVVAHLRADVDLEALVGENIGTELAADRAAPYVQVQRLPGIAETAETAWLKRFRVQVGSWAEPDDKVTAYNVAEAVEVSLFAMPEAAHALGVVTGVDVELDAYWAPDPETDDPRYLEVFAVWAHPLKSP